MANIITFFGGRGKSSVPGKKRRILDDADREIQNLESQKTERTRQIERETGVYSDITKKQREVAKKARLLMREN